jgi:hypothetical protein
LISLPVTVLFVWKDGFWGFRIAEFKQAGRLLRIKKIRDSSKWAIP